MADQDDQNKTAGSPWEEVLDVAEDEKPKIFGTLDSGANPASPPGGQLKVPTNIPQGVGSKVSGEQVANTESALQQAPPAPQAPLVPTPSPAAPPAPTQPQQPRVGGISSLVKPKPAPPSPVGPPVQNTGQVFVNRGAAPSVPNLNQPTATPELTVPKKSVSSVSQNLAKPIQEWLAKPKVIITAIIVVLFVGLTYFNETGILSSGLEKVYGIFRIEALWGGLPADSQLALTQSFQKMKTEKSMSLDSEIKFTVNKSSESNITKPLLSLKNPIYLFALDKAILAASTTTSVLTQDDITTLEPSESPIADTALDPTPDTIATPSTTDQTTQTTSPDSASSQSSQSDQGTSATSLDNLTTVKEFSSSGKSYLSADGATSQMEITDESGKKNDISLYAQSSRLYVNSTGVDYSGSSKGWVYFPLAASNSQEILPAVFSKPNLSGFSVTGKRIGSGKFNGEPVYRYQVNIKIGSLLENIGVTDDMVNSITGEIDISKKDQLIRYFELTITPSISSAITRIDLKMAVSGYNSAQSLTFPANAVEAGSAADTTVAPATTTPATTPSTTAPAINPSAPSDLLARDAQRKADLKSIELALSSYYATYKFYPRTNGSVIQTRTSGNILSKVLVPKYIASLPVDPWTDKYYYGYTSDGSTYELSALLGNSSDPDGVLTGSNNFYIIRH